MHDLFIAMNGWFEQWGLLGLAINSCVESFFLLPPPDILLITMDLKNPQLALWYAFVCTLSSAIGGVIGYGIGLFGGRPAFNLLFKKYHKQFENVEKLYDKYGMLAVFISAFTPIPYKIFTIASGILKMNFLQFFLASFRNRNAWTSASATKTSSPFSLPEQPGNPNKQNKANRAAGISP